MQVCKDVKHMDIIEPCRRHYPLRITEAVCYILGDLNKDAE